MVLALGEYNVVSNYDAVQRQNRNQFEKIAYIKEFSNYCMSKNIIKIGNAVIKNNVGGQIVK